MQTLSRFGAELAPLLSEVKDFDWIDQHLQNHRSTVIGWELKDANRSKPMIQCLWHFIFVAHICSWYYVFVFFLDYKSSLGFKVSLNITFSIIVINLPLSTCND